MRGCLDTSSSSGRIVPTHTNKEAFESIELFKNYYEAISVNFAQAKNVVSRDKKWSTFRFFANDENNFRKSSLSWEL